MYTHLKERTFYKDIYDSTTVKLGRHNLASFEKFREKYLEITKDKPDSLRSTLHLNWFYMLMIGNELVERHDNRDSRIQEMMAEDEAKDRQLGNARLSEEPNCRHCGKTGLRIIDKSLLGRDSINSAEEVLFMLKCSHCQKNSAYWQDGTLWELPPTPCPKCKAAMTKKDARRGKVITTTYTCPDCGHSFKEKLDFTTKKEKADLEFSKDRFIFGLRDKKMLEEHRDAKWRLEGLIQMGKEFKEKQDNKHIYDALAKLKKLKIAELEPLLAPALKKAGYAEFSLDKPEIGKDVIVGFNCLDGKSDREDYDSIKTLKKLVDKTIANTNWKLMSDGISYRLGYLNGRFRAYESKEDLLQLIKRSIKLKTNPKTS